MLQNVFYLFCEGVLGLVQLLEKLSYDKNSSVNFNNIKRFKTELKWIKLLQTASPLGLNDNIYHEGNISKMPDFDVFSLLEIRKRKSNEKAMNRNWGNQKTNPALKNKLGNNQNHKYTKYNEHKGQLSVQLFPKKVVTQQPKPS